MKTLAIPPYYRVLVYPDGNYEIRSDSRWAKGKALTPTLGIRGYYVVTLVISAQRKVQRKVHHLVAEAVWGPMPEGMQVNHVDGDKLNNNANNLEYVTPTENMQHALRLGLWDPAKCGLDNPAYKHGKRMNCHFRNLHRGK